MSVLRQANLLGQQRYDIPHIRALEAAAAADFDLLAGTIMAGRKPLVVQGFNLIPLAPGTAATSLQLVVANSVLLHPQASETGTIFVTAVGRAPETLNASNARVTGSFTASAVNFIGVDLRRTADAATTDLVQFLDANTNLETPKEVPLARTLDYIIVITNQDFSTLPTVAPLAKVVTDANNRIVSVQDARNLTYRLGAGGGLPNALHAFAWPGGRTEVGDNSDFGAGDKVITSLKDWQDAVMTRLFELGGGEYWYSATADRNVRMTTTGATFPNGEWFTWDGTNLHWQGVSFLFDNSTAFRNDVQDQTVDNAGQTDLADGDCLYVDLDRTTFRTGGTALVAKKAALHTLGTPALPGSRFIMAYRIGAQIFTRDSSFQVGSTFFPATTTALGIVKILTVANNPASPVVPSADTTNSNVVAAGLSRSGAGGSLAAGAVTIAAGANDTSLVLGQILGGGFPVTVNGALTQQNPGTNNPGIVGSGDGHGAGVQGFGGLGSVLGFGAPTGNGVYGTGGANGGAGVLGQGQLGGDARGGMGVLGQGTSAGHGIGVVGTADEVNTTLTGDPGANGIGVVGNASAAIQDVTGLAGAGVLGYGTAFGVLGIGIAGGEGGRFQGNGGAPGMRAIGGSSGPAIIAQAGAGGTCMTTAPHASNVTPQIEYLDTGGNLRALVDYNGYPMGRVSRLYQDWNIDGSGGSLGDAVVLPGSQFYTRISGASTITPAPPTTHYSAPILDLFNGGGVGDQAYVYSRNGFFHAGMTGLVAVFEVDIGVVTNGVGGNINLHVGFTDTPLRLGSDPNASTNFIRFRTNLAAIGDTWHAETHQGGFTGTGGTFTRTDTTNGDPNARLRIEVHGTGSALGLVCRFSVNEAPFSDVTVVPTSTSPLYCYIGMQSSVGVSTHVYLGSLALVWGRWPTTPAL